MALSRQINENSHESFAGLQSSLWSTHSAWSGGGDLCSALSQYCVTSYNLQVFLQKSWHLPVWSLSLNGSDVFEGRLKLKSCYPRLTLHTWQAGPVKEIFAWFPLQPLGRMKLSALRSLACGERELGGGMGLSSHSDKRSGQNDALSGRNLEKTIVATQDLLHC